MDALDKASIEAAFARLSKPQWRLRCGWCGHEDAVPDDPEKAVYTCDQCGTRTAFGMQQPRTTFNPHPDRRFVVARWEIGKKAEPDFAEFFLDREFGAAVALDLLSVCAPDAWNALMAWKKAQVERESTPAPENSPEDALRAENRLPV